MLSSVRYHILIIIMIMLCVQVDKAAARSKKYKDGQRNPVALSMPVPDEPVLMAKREKDVPPIYEAADPNGLDLLMREGMDVSHYQGMIDWKTVAQEGHLGYVYLKATEGASLVDDTYEYNLREARKNGLKVGSYHFFRAQVSQDEQLENMFSTIRAKDQDLLPIIDVEHMNRVSHGTFVERLHRFMEAVTRHYGRRPILYTFVNFYNRYLQGEGFDKYPLMIAFYRDAQPELNDGRQYVIWQYTAQGSMPGVDGDVDLSRLTDGFTINDIRF